MQIIWITDNQFLFSIKTLVCTSKCVVLQERLARHLLLLRSGSYYGGKKELTLDINDLTIINLITIEVAVLIYCSISFSVTHLSTLKFFTNKSEQDHKKCKKKNIELNYFMIKTGASSALLKAQKEK